MGKEQGCLCRKCLALVNASPQSPPIGKSPPHLHSTIEFVSIVLNFIHWKTPSWFSYTFDFAQKPCRDVHSVKHKTKKDGNFVLIVENPTKLLKVIRQNTALLVRTYTGSCKWFTLLCNSLELSSKSSTSLLLTLYIEGILIEVFNRFFLKLEFPKSCYLFSLHILKKNCQN